ncbi:MAG: flagellar basal body P-ring protein FlgI [Gammaproteobacteria bacterium]|nr:flagellar basal body P-ring protein FlgI [Gammaproteobacteria bacterium]MDH3768903.1 flagellar basal body P-ring protein FlgI [Gammaproteobacteria bacterium]
MRILFSILICGLTSQQVCAERIKDLAAIAGVRTNQLVGYGLVVGLEGTGDQTSQAPFTVQSMKNFLQQFGVTVPENSNPQLKNVAAVSLHAELPPFAKPGQSIDITVSSLGNASSLRGGSLLMAPLRGADGEIYALAQGNVIVSGFGASGNDGSRVTVNTTSAGRIPNGAMVERSVPSNFTTMPAVFLNLHTPDFTTANRLTEAVNEMLGDGTAQSLDPTSIKIAAPIDPSQRISFVSVLENIELEPADAPARVIVNSRTGTVVIGSHVRVSPAAVSHGSLTVTITESPQVSQPGAFSDGDTVVVNRSDIEIIEDQQRMFLFEPGVTLNEIVTAVNQVGAAPGDLVAILEALKQAGSLHAELIVI